MRKILIAVLIIILIAGISLTLVNGITLGRIQISSLKQLSEKDVDLENNIKKLKQMKDAEFVESIDELNQTVKKFKSKKEEYALLVSDTTEEGLTGVVTAQKYEVEYLWVKLGNYATKNGVTLKLNILNASAGLENVYDLQFTLNGKYAGITDFVYEVENDSTLGFKIDSFSLMPTTVNTQNENQGQSNTTDTEILTATFTVKNVSIDIGAQQIVQTTESAEQNMTTQGTDTTNTTNTVK